MEKEIEELKIKRDQFYSSLIELKEEHEVLLSKVNSLKLEITNLEVKKESIINIIEHEKISNLKQMIETLEREYSTLLKKTNKLKAKT